MGSRPVGGRPLFFGLAFIDIGEYWLSLKASRGEADTSASALTLAKEPSMARADQITTTTKKMNDAIPQSKGNPITAAAPADADQKSNCYGNLEEQICDLVEPPIFRRHLSKAHCQKAGWQAV
jgi:hypothetical protein